jgi:hypothetical protein
MSLEVIAVGTILVLVLTVYVFFVLQHSRFGNFVWFGTLAAVLWGSFVEIVPQASNADATFGASAIRYGFFALAVAASYASIAYLVMWLIYGGTFEQEE